MTDMRRAAARTAGCVIAAAAIGVVLSGPADARPWTADYSWQDTTTGFENWTAEPEGPVFGVPAPFYDVRKGDAPATVGRGLVLRPVGGKYYGNGDPTKQDGGPATIVRWKAPGASRITAATFDDLGYRNENDDQYFRLRVRGNAEAVGDTEDYGPNRGQADPDQTYEPPTRIFTPLGGSTTAEAWMFTVCHPNPPGSGAFACPTIPTTTGTFGRIGRATFTLDDPDRPIVEVASDPDIADGWVNKKRAQNLTIKATDPSSGVARVRVRATNDLSASGGPLILDHTVACDRTHRTADRGGLNCPPAATATTRDPAASQGQAGRVYTVTATDDAGNESEPVVKRVRYDLKPPNDANIRSGPGDVLDAWTSRTDVVPVTVSATDDRSGLQRLELVAQRNGAGRKTSLGSSAVTVCQPGCRRATVAMGADLSRVGRDGTYKLLLRATDRAGNTKDLELAKVLRIDRTAPRPRGPAPTYTRSRDGRIRIVFTPARDDQTGSGRIREYVVRYEVDVANGLSSPLGSQANIRFAQIAVGAASDATETETRFRKVTSRTVTFSPEPGFRASAPLSLIELDDTSGIGFSSSGRLRPEDVGGFPGNAAVTVAKTPLDKGFPSIVDFLVHPEKYLTDGCGAEANVTSTRKAAGDDVQNFVSTRTYVNGTFKYECRNAISNPANGEIRAVRFTFDVRVKDRSGREHRIGIKTVLMKGHGNRKGSISPTWLCSAKAGMPDNRPAEARVYLSTVVYKDDNGDKVDKKKKTFRLLTKDKLGVKCPNRTLRMKRRALAFLALSRHSVKDYGRTGKAEGMLGAELGGAPWAPADARNPWSAHHIIPIGRGGIAKSEVSNRVRDLAFICHIHPNDAVNGIWLRARGLVKTIAEKDEDGKRRRVRNPFYTQLVRHDEAEGSNLHKRTHHYDTYSGKYRSQLKKAIGGAYSTAWRRETCNGSAMRTRMRKMQTLLRNGEFGSEKKDIH